MKRECVIWFIFGFTLHYILDVLAIVFALFLVKSEKKVIEFFLYLILFIVISYIVSTFSKGRKGMKE